MVRTRKISTDRKDRFSRLVRRIKGMGTRTEEVLQRKRPENLPCHVVLIPDGNRRWAREKGWHPWVGHKIGMCRERFESFFSFCSAYDIKYLSFWGFSTENWDRDGREIDYLWNIYRKSIGDFRDQFIKKGINLRHMGRKDRLPKDIVDSLKQLEEETKLHDKMYFQFCLDYGGRDDIVRGVNKLLKRGVKKIEIQDISDNLDSAGIPDPDLIIRTSGEQRLSGIMAFQAVYAELYFTRKYFPDFEVEDFYEALCDYSVRTRRFGGTAEEDLAKYDQSMLEDPSGSGAGL